MKILNIYSPNAITEATELLGSGHVIIYPTDTLYGLGADALNSRAVEKISKNSDSVGYLSIFIIKKLFSNVSEILFEEKKCFVKMELESKSD